MRPCTLLLSLALVGCAGPGQPEADALADALARQVRHFYGQRLALEEGVSPADLDAGRDPARALEDALAAAELSPASAAELTSGSGAAFQDGEVLARARNFLLRHDYVFPPVPPSDPGLCLAKVRSRTTGLEQRVWGRTVHYRRVRHAAPLLPDYTTFRALRTGQGPLPPAARLAGPTVFLDVDAIARRAGQGPYVGWGAEAVSAHLELGQVAALRFRDEIRAEELEGPGRGPALVEALVRVWLTLLRYGEGDLALQRLRWEVARSGPASPWGQAAAWVHARLREGDDVRALSGRLLQALPPR